MKRRSEALMALTTAMARRRGTAMRPSAADEFRFVFDTETAAAIDLTDLVVDLLLAGWAEPPTPEEVRRAQDDGCQMAMSEFLGRGRDEARRVGQDICRLMARAQEQGLAGPGDLRAAMLAALGCVRLVMGREAGEELEAAWNWRW
jgi:hypothetical protein